VLTDGGYPPLRLGADEVASLARVRFPPGLTAAAAIVVDLDAGQTLYALRADDPLAPASTAKIMTALVVLQNADVADPAIVSANAAETPGSRMGLVAGETLTVGDLLHGLLMASGNDAAVALAEHVAGSEAAFVALMNQTAAVLGLGATRFTNSHGLDEAGQTSSASDLVVMTEAALAYPIFGQIVASSEAEVAGRVLTTTNQLLDAYPGADGIKTGTTDAAGECLVASVTRGGHRVAAVVLGSSDRYADARALLDYASAGWRWGSAGLPDNALAWVLDVQRAPHRLYAQVAPELFLPAWQWPLLQPVRALDVTAPLTGTLPVGSLAWMLGSRTVMTVPLTVLQGP
jgi:D-alanyl-D-alanine carboxypeptidase